MADHLVRRGSVYWFRQRIPACLVDQLAQRELHLSLRTVSRNVARKRAMRLRIRLEELWIAMARSPTLQRAQARALIDAMLEEAISDDPEVSPTIAELVESASSGKPASDYARMVISPIAFEEIGQLTEDKRKAVEDRLRYVSDRSALRVAQTRAEHYRVHHGALAHAALEALDEARAHAADAEARARDAEQAAARLKVSEDISRTVTSRIDQIADSVATGTPGKPIEVHIPDDPEEPEERHPAPVSVSRKGKARRKLSDYYDAFSKWRLRIGRTHGVLNQELGTFRRFVDFAGDKPAADYDRGDVNGFLDKLRQLPSKYGRRPSDKDLSLDQLIARADAAERKARAEKSPIPDRLTDKTAKRHLSTLSQIFKFAFDQGDITLAQKKELTDEHSFASTQCARDQRDTWTLNELKILFASPVYTGCESEQRRGNPGNEVIRDARFWLPLLGLLHGARVEEFADLYGRDIQCIDGTWVFVITPIHGDEESGTKERRLKTYSAKRIVPLHPEIIKMGFIDYIRQTCKKPNDPVFADLEPEGKDQKRGPAFTRWFGRYRQHIGVYREGVGMHAFRHVVATRLSDVITTHQQVRHRDYVLGHAPSGTEGDTRYDKGPGLKAVAKTLELLTYPELDLSHLYVG